MKKRSKSTKVRHTCVTCQDKKTCFHPHYVEKVPVLIKEKYLKGDPISCSKWKRHPDKEEFNKWRFDEKVRFGRRGLQPPYFELIGKDPEFTEWAHKLSKRYKLTEEDLKILNRKLQDIHIRYEISRGMPMMRYQALDNFHAYCYALLMDEYVHNVLKVTMCRECGKPTKRLQYCSDKCSTKARVRRHRFSL